MYLDFVKNSLKGDKTYASGLAAKLSIGMLLLDVEKVFDCVWLLEYRFAMVYRKLIWSFLTARKFHVTVAGERSAECEECHRVQFSQRHSSIYTEIIICGRVGFFLTCDRFFFMPITGHVLCYYWLYCVVD
jgi:hypothetical protein